MPVPFVEHGEHGGRGGVVLEVEHIGGVEEWRAVQLAGVETCSTEWWTWVSRGGQQSCSCVAAVKCMLYIFMVIEIL